MSYDPGFDATVGALPMNIPQAPTAKHKLQLSHLKLTQLEMMGEDVDLKHMYASFNGGGVDLAGAMTDAVVERTVQGASTLTLTVTDNDWRLLNSGLLSDQLTVEVDGLYWMLVTVKISNFTVTLTFQEREVVIARRYNKPIKQSTKTSRGQITRAQFALRLLREIKELPPIPYVIPALKVKQPIGAKAGWLAHNEERTHAKGFGIPKHNNLKVKTGPMNEEERINANIILDVALSHVMPRKYFLAAMICGIAESGLVNLKPTPSNFHVGVFQQDPAYWPASRDVAKDATAFLKRLGQTWAAHPNASIADAVYLTQNPGPSIKPSFYGQWLDNANKIVDYYGVVPGGQGSAADANNTYNAGQSDVVYEFYRGRPPTSAYQKKHGDAKWGRENTWDCWQRLASEVQWRCFFVSGTFYFITEDDLFKQHPILTIREDMMWGIDQIDGTYDSQGNSSDITLTCRMGRWAAPPGSIVHFDGFGPWQGRWIVNDVSRSLFKDVGTIVLKKRLPALPEPDSTNVSTASGTGNGKWGGGGKGTGKGSGNGTASSEQFLVGSAMVQPIPKGYNSKIIQGMHQTAGLPGYPAADFGANAGAPVVAVEGGTIVRLSGHDPNEGPWDPVLGVHGPFGWSIYLMGNSGTEYYYTHLGSRSVHVGQKVSEAQEIATVGNYAKYGGANHTHVGVHAGPKGHPNIYDLMRCPQAVKKS